jgi:cytochrome c oxidase subunit 1
VGSEEGAIVTVAAEQELPPVHQGLPPPPRGWRRLVYPGFLRAAWMTPLFFGIGSGIVVLCRWWGGWHPIWFGSIIVLVAALIAGPVGFLAGIGAFDYWTRYAIGAPTRPEDHSGHGAYSWRDYFRVNTDHKVIGIQYLTTTIFFFLAGGLLALSWPSPGCSTSTTRPTTVSSPSTRR